MRDRINCLIDFAADNPYALKIRYHHKCWLKYVHNYQWMSEDDKLPYLHNVTLCEAQTIVFDHIRAVIFDEHKLRSIQAFFETMALLCLDMVFLHLELSHPISKKS